METQKTKRKLRVAVIGGGIAGITAAYQLERDHHVSLFESNDYVGGHTHTIILPSGADAGTPVDTGFIVLNDRTYPILNRFFKQLGVTIQKSDMSFSYYCPKSGFQYASSNVSSLFAQRRNILDPSYWRMLIDILRFNRMVLRKHQSGLLADLTLGQFLQQQRFCDRLREHYLYPMVAAIWSAPDALVDQFPMLTFARFFNNHGLLTVHKHPQWYTVTGGSHTYVKAFLNQFGGTVHIKTAIASIRRTPEEVLLKTTSGEVQRFDRVVIATHADEALKLLDDPSDDEHRLLSPWRYSINRTILHSDIRWMPTNRRAWASWNVIREAHAKVHTPVTLTYYMNQLQRLNTQSPYLVTLNPFNPIARNTIIAEMTYTHPTYTFNSLATQRHLHRLNGVRNTAFCGSYFGYGFHEDAARAGVQAAEALGAHHEF